MNRISRGIISFFCIAMLLTSCNSTPDEVLPQEKMAQLLADIHIGESIVDAERTKFYSDSLKKTVKQSILVKHNVSQAQLDTSFSWYGHHIEEYIAVYDRVIEILDDEINEYGSLTDELASVTLDGDSVDTWKGVSHYKFTKNSPSQFLSFNLPKDYTWKNGDFYTWKIKVGNKLSQIKWSIAADYSDGSSEFINSTATNEGWNEIQLVSDSTKTLNRVYGYIYITPNDSENVYIDSISLIRKRCDKIVYRQRFVQKTFDIENKASENADNEDVETNTNTDSHTPKTLTGKSFKQHTLSLHGN